MLLKGAGLCQNFSAPFCITTNWSFMLTIIVPGIEFFDEQKQEFVTHGDTKVELEHSLLSVSKWESKFQKPFLAPGTKTTEEILWYVKAMVLSDGFSDELLNKFSEKNFTQINEYINSSESATTFTDHSKKVGRSEIVTSELIYYWMVAFTIPFECETWHLNRLFSLIRICSIKNSKPKKMSRAEIAAQHRELNEQRKKKLGTSG